MDNLQHIDELLKSASQAPANTLVNDSDWNAIDKKLKQRKNRIYALWFFLALVSVSFSGLLLWNNANHISEEQNITEAIPSNTIPSTSLSENNTENNTELTVNDPVNKADLQSSETTINSTHKTLSNDVRRVLVNMTTDELSSTNGVSELSTTIGNIHNATKQEATSAILLDKKNITIIDYAYNGQAPDKLLVSPIAISYSQNKENNAAHWEIGFAFTPSVSSKIVTTNNAYAGLLNKEYNSLVKSSESAAFANSYGLNLQYHTKSNFYFAFGLFTSQRTETINYDYTITSFPEVNQGLRKITGYGQLNPLAYEQVQYKGSNSYHFIEIPLNIGYKLPISRKFEIRSQVGVSYLGLLNATGKKGNPTYLRLNSLQEMKLPTKNIAANIKSGVYYNTTRFAIGVEPIVGLNLTSISERTSPIKTNPYSYGINISTNFKLLKK